MKSFSMLTVNSDLRKMLFDGNSLRIESGSLYFLRIRRRDKSPVPAVTGGRNVRDQDQGESELSAVCITDRSAKSADFLSGRERVGADRRGGQVKNAEKDERSEAGTEERPDDWQQESSAEE